MWIKIPRNYLCNLSSSAFIVIVKYSFLSYVKHYYFQTVDKNYFKKCGNVDNLFFEQCIADNINVSGSHSYQQFSRPAICQYKFFNIIKIFKKNYVSTFFSECFF